MSTFFGKTEHKFDADVSEGLKLIPFLNACRSYVAFYDLFGGTFMSPIKSDVNGNVAKLQGKFCLDFIGLTEFFIFGTQHI